MHIQSPVKAIDALYIRDLDSGHHLKNCEVIRAGQTILVKNEYGAVYQFGLANGSYPLTEWPWLTGILKALIKFKLISKQDYEDHHYAAEERSRDQDASIAAVNLATILATYGLKPSKKQQAFIDQQAP